MGKRKTIFQSALLLLFLAGCGQNEVLETSPEPKVNIEENHEIETIDVSKVQSICELVTLRCYYNNVARSVKEAGNGITHIGEKERKFWIEYTGIAEVSYDVSQISIEQQGTMIHISIPDPTISYSVEEGSWNTDSYVIEADNLIQQNPITQEDQVQAINEAQLQMQEEVEQNKILLSSAELQLKELIEDYIHEVGKVTGTEYQIVWE
ncbi:MAG: DUF4230 domain-containing protein [Lachnospiraceae bacterium]|nr:DUF4230 domain-containing protein [Lachnospiraceae bacterium]MBO6300619.1 DUF4230 domain-containing protein [Lachnospiraceae bacterium]